MSLSLGTGLCISALKNLKWYLLSDIGHVLPVTSEQWLRAPHGGLMFQTHVSSTYWPMEFKRSYICVEKIVILLCLLYSKFFFQFTLHYFCQLKFGIQLTFFPSECYQFRLKLLSLLYNIISYRPFHSCYICPFSIEQKKKTPLLKNGNRQSTFSFQNFQSSHYCTNVGCLEIIRHQSLSSKSLHVNS